MSFDLSPFTAWSICIQIRRRHHPRNVSQKTLQESCHHQPRRSEWIIGWVIKNCLACMGEPKIWNLMKSQLYTYLSSEGRLGTAFISCKVPTGCACNSRKTTMHFGSLVCTPPLMVPSSVNPWIVDVAYLRRAQACAKSGCHIFATK